MSAGKKKESKSPSPIFVRTYDLLLWLIRATTGFPRSQRFVLARMVQWTILQFQERLIEAGLQGKRNPALALDRLGRADLLLVKLRFYLRLCHDLTLLSDGSYAHVFRMVDEVGRLLGAWIKKLRLQAQAGGVVVQAELEDLAAPDAWAALI